MKAVILAGGFGSRLSEETTSRPKPMVEVGGMPILWHIMKIYSHYGINEFIICLGYKGNVIKEYFVNYFLHTSDVTIDLMTNGVEIHKTKAEPWTITLVDTGESTQTGGRLKRVKHHLGDETFCMTYGDGVGDIAIDKLIQFHKDSGRLATVTAVAPLNRFGILHIEDDQVTSFREKPKDVADKISAGFFVLEPAVIDRIDDDPMRWEMEPMDRLRAEGQLGAFHHDGFWHPMDTLRDRNFLEEHWASGKAPWKLWA